jgi:hypothetical protein
LKHKWYLLDRKQHIEWKTPAGLSDTVTGQDRGNSGIGIPGNYEVQILESYTNRVYRNGQAGVVYMQYAPLVNSSRIEGEWQTSDIFTSTAFAWPSWAWARLQSRTGKWPLTGPIMQNLAIQMGKIYLSGLNSRKSIIPLCILAILQNQVRFQISINLN